MFPDIKSKVQMKNTSKNNPGNLHPRNVVIT